MANDGGILMTDIILPLLLTSLAGYFIGSINFALIVSRIAAYDDVRSHGSGNAGAANMLRTYGKKAALFTALGDALKAVLACLLARIIFDIFAVHPGFDPAYSAGFFVLLGHIFPVFFEFRGGKGVMSALGIILIADPAVFLVSAVIAVPVFLITRTISLVSIISAALLPVLTVILCLIFKQEPLFPAAMTLAYAVLVIFSHRDNIRRLLRGEEKSMSRKNK